MYNYQIPLVSFPLKLLFVDDNESVLRLLCSNFHDKYECQTAKSVTEALDIINNIPQINYNLFSFFNNNTDLKTENSDSQFSIDFAKIHSLIANNEKYNDIGIVVTDYNMGEENGLDLCKQIENKNIKKILLTGEFDISNGINAMNTQLIDRYINKSSDSIISDLEKYINALHTVYFNQSYAIHSDLLKQSKLSVLNNPEYVEIFNKIIEDYKIKEFYLIDYNGSFLMINQKKERFIFNFHTNNSLDEFVEMYQNEKPVNSLINGVKTRDLIPFFGMFATPTSTDLSNWYKHFDKANKSQNFFWNLIKV